MPEFAIREEPLGNGIVLLRLSGFLDAHTFEELEDAVGRKFTEGSFKLIVDMAKVDYISSAGAGGFIWAHTESQENGGDVIVLNPTKGVMQVFELLGLIHIFRVARTREEALAAF